MEKSRDYKKQDRDSVRKIDKFIKVRNRRSYYDKIREKMIVVLALLPCFWAMSSGINYIQDIGMWVAMGLMIFMVFFDI